MKIESESVTSLFSGRGPPGEQPQPHAVGRGRGHPPPLMGQEGFPPARVGGPRPLPPPGPGMPGNRKGEGSINLEHQVGGERII